MKRLLIYLKDYKKESILAPLFKLLEAIFELFVPLVVAAVIDRGIGEGGDSSFVVRRCLLLGLLALIGLAASLTAQFFAARAAVGFSSQLRHALFVRLQGFSYSQTDALGAPAMITRMTSDINQVQTGLNLTLRLLLRSPFIVFGASVMALTVDASSAVYFLLLIPVLFVVVFAVMLTTIPLYGRVQAGVDSLLSRVRENLAGVRVIRAFRGEAAQTEAFRGENGELTERQLHAGRISAVMNPATYVIVNIFIILLIYKGAIQVDGGRMTQGEVYALYGYMAQILVELVKLANLIITLTKSAACANRISDVLADDCAEEALVEGEGGNASPYAAASGVPVLRMTDAGLRYAGAGANALSGIDLEAYAGETVGVIGGTGSGKSSLVGLIPRFYDATEGTVEVFGSEAKTLDLERLRASVGVVPQHSLLFRGTIRDNLLWGSADASDEELLAALEAAQALDVLATRPEGLDAEVEQGGLNFSGGQRQRLCIARALVRRPAILILDDSASALDFATEAALRRSIRSLDYDPTVFIISQRATSVMHADRIVVLDEGRMAGCGTHDELLQSCPVYREIWDSQTREGANA